MGTEEPLSVPSQDADQRPAPEQALIRTGILFLGTLLFAVLANSIWGDPTGSQGALLWHISAQQILVLGGLTFLWTRDQPAMTFGGAWPWRGILIGLCLATGMVLLQPPLLELWAEPLGLEEPSWYAAALLLTDPGVSVAVFVAVALIPALCEEAFFRGYLLTRLLPWGLWPALGLQALVFAAYHIDLYGLPIYLISGLVLGVLRMRTGSLWPAIVLHATNNAWGILEHHWGEPTYLLWWPWSPLVILGLFGVAAWMLRSRAE